MTTFFELEQFAVEICQKKLHFLNKRCSLTNLKDNPFIKLIKCEKLSKTIYILIKRTLEIISF